MWCRRALIVLPPRHTSAARHATAQFQPSSYKCGNKGADPCDADDYCKGDKNECIDKVKSNDEVCRPNAAGTKCDVPGQWLV